MSVSSFRFFNNFVDSNPNKYPMDFNVQKICRICLEEGAVTSIFSTEFAMAPSTMMMMCARIRVHKDDGLPSVICNNCIYRLGVAYHFKQECENSDIRLREYLGIPDKTRGFTDAGTNTDVTSGNRWGLRETDKVNNSEEDDLKLKRKRKRRYERKSPTRHKKRGPKPLQKLVQTCYECNKSFKCLAQLQMHMRIHTGEKPFICNYCPSRFAQKYNLVIHERTHTGERPFQCEKCSKQFSALGNFQAHQKIHFGVRNQCCPICQKTFYSVGDLSKHMIIHTGMKNHHCDICGKAFSRQRDMQAHKRKIHVMELNTISEENAVIDADHVPVNTSNGFKCSDCNKDFTASACPTSNFRSHTNSNLMQGHNDVHGQTNNNNFPLAQETLHLAHPPSNPSTSMLAPASQTITSSVLNHSGPQINRTPPVLSMAVTHVAMPHIFQTHIIPPLPHPPSTPNSHNTLSMMHSSQRIHPY